MRPEEKERLTRHRDTSQEAISWRLRAALKAERVKQIDIAADLGSKATTINSQIAAGSPSVSLIAYLYKNFRIDFNFILFGDYAQLPRDVEERLLATLVALEQ